jgi:hypothetical protein
MVIGAARRRARFAAEAPVAAGLSERRREEG